MSREDSGGTLAAFLLGAVAGAVAGVLLAPKSGKETREELADWLQERRAKGEEFLSKIKDEGGYKKDAIEAAIRAGKQAFAEASGREKA
jgi:gas vesicle protein